ncbi:hypothetical protein [Paeniglutamicibacter kerguelensis]|uniref:Uncharacterized protein n=1 Tax=Paeniglutamicibacter kerguelensis TaxID=254788 RepID=A0ABS4XB29_9MICC|nr:hypothetical protein [Paeniglutamicibacter kerguelensis]MBP2385671.1 hypothetical protein [Paeniglutamicibacter kerguelensis]
MAVDSRRGSHFVARSKACDEIGTDGKTNTVSKPDEFDRGDVVASPLPARIDLVKVPAWRRSIQHDY